MSLMLCSSSARSFNDLNLVILVRGLFGRFSSRLLMHRLVLDVVTAAAVAAGSHCRVFSLQVHDLHDLHVVVLSPHGGGRRVASSIRCH